MGDGGCREAKDGTTGDAIDLFTTDTMLGSMSLLGVEGPNPPGSSPCTHAHHAAGLHNSFQLTSSVDDDGVKLSLLVIDSMIQGEEVRRPQHPECIWLAACRGLPHTLLMSHE